MTKEEFESFKNSGTKEAEAIKYLEKDYRENLQRAVKDICDIVISRYDMEIAESKNKIEALKKEVAQFDVVLWEEASL